MAMQIRLAEAADAHAIAEVHLRSWQFGHQGSLPKAVIDSITVQERETSWGELLSRPGLEKTILLAERDGAVIGFTSSGPSRGPVEEERTAEIYEFFVDPEVIGRGVGQALLEETLGGLAKAGFRAVTLWVIEGNDRARRFYERQGFRTDGATKTTTTANVEATEVRYGMQLPSGSRPAPSRKLG